MGMGGYVGALLLILLLLGRREERTIILNKNYYLLLFFWGGQISPGSQHLHQITCCGDAMLTIFLGVYMWGSVLRCCCLFGVRENAPFLLGEREELGLHYYNITNVCYSFFIVINFNTL